MNTKMSIEWEEIPLSKIIEYFAKDFKPRAGKIYRYEHFIDIKQNTVVFKIYIEEEKSSNKEI